MFFLQALTNGAQLADFLILLWPLAKAFAGVTRQNPQRATRNIPQHFGLKLLVGLGAANGRQRRDQQL
jgi:hypothetical protein